MATSLSLTKSRPLINSSIAPSPLKSSSVASSSTSSPTLHQSPLLRLAQSDASSACSSGPTTARSHHRQAGYPAALKTTDPASITQTPPPLTCPQCRGPLTWLSPLAPEVAPHETVTADHSRFPLLSRHRGDLTAPSRPHSAGNHKKRLSPLTQSLSASTKKPASPGWPPLALAAALLASPFIFFPHRCSTILSLTSLDHSNSK